VDIRLASRYSFFPMIKRRIVNFVKRLLFGTGSRPRSVWLGPLAGAKFTTDPGHDTHRIIGIYELEIASRFRRLAQRAGGVVDVGTNDGYYAIAAAVINPNVKVVGYEGNASHQPVFEANRDANAIGSDRAAFVNSFVGTSHVRLDDAAKNVPRPVLVKIDVEGAEADVLLSGESCLSEPGTMVLIETHSLELENQCIAILQRHGFKTEIIRPGWYRKIVPELGRLPHNQWLLAEKT
jgi:precorrin-6B methylase 2